jgi:hypothetical protein
MHITMTKEGCILQWPKKDTYYNDQRRIHITMAKEGYILQWPKKDTYYTVRTFGILYAELLEVYDGGSGNTAFMGSLLLFTFAITGKYDGQVFIISFKCHNSYIYH